MPGLFYATFAVAQNGWAPP